MSLIRPLNPAQAWCKLPKQMTSPFNKTPDPLAWRACEQLQAWLSEQSEITHDVTADDGGKMFGVLVVKDKNDRIGYLAAFSGMLAGRWQLPGFVPPVFDQNERDAFLPQGEEKLASYSADIHTLSNCVERRNLQIQYEALSEQRDIELQAMKGLHKQRKAARHAQREQSEDAGLLKKLATESQQDKREYKNLLLAWQDKLTPLLQNLTAWQDEITLLKKARQQLSNKLQRQVFSGYDLKNWQGESRSLASFFPDKQPPGGAGDCAGPKLLHYALEQQLTPIAMAEFWWGALPKETIRHHGHYYPACRGKCHPILPFMLKGIEVLPRQIPGSDFDDAAAPYVVYEDEDVLVVNKPSGLLSVPGKEIEDSVLTRIQKRYPLASGPLLVHRLDLATSGLLLIAKNQKAHKALQRQFLKRTIEKRYVAVLSKRLGSESGVIDLPLRVDLMDRPRHCVCHQYGKPAKSRWQVIAKSESTTRVYFYPETGRTHQLRIHAAHAQGLNAPIVGDELYGDKDERLMLHAEYLVFTHPVNAKRIEVSVPSPF